MTIKTVDWDRQHEQEAKKIPGQVEWGNWDKKITQEGQTVWAVYRQLVNGKTLSPLTKDTWE